MKEKIITFLKELKEKITKKHILIASIGLLVALSIILTTVFLLPNFKGPKQNPSGSSVPTNNNQSKDDSNPDSSTESNSQSSQDSALQPEPEPPVETPLDNINYPAPTLVESPLLLKEFPKPTANISTSFSDKFSVSFSGKTAQGAPEISTITEQAGPNDSVSIYGVGFENAKVYAYGLSKGKGALKLLKTTSQREDFINAVIDPNFDYGMYIIWVQGANGATSAPVRVNAPKLSWISAEKASENAQIRVYGKFLTTGNADGNDAKSYVYLTDQSSAYKVDVIESSPYRLTIKLPAGLKNNTNYKIWVHNGHGGSYGWSNSLSITYNSSAENFWNGTKKTVKVTNGKATDSDILDAINSAQKGDTIYLPAGTYVINDQIKVNKSVRFQGEDKEKVIIVCVFAATKKKDVSLAYGDLNVNSSCTAAFDVSATPCEFSNLTFTEFVNNSTLYSGVSAPSGYGIDYAHGMFIRGKDTYSDTGVSGQFKIDNCNFKVQRTHSDTNCAYITNTTTQNNLHKQFEAKYKHYSRTAYSSSPLWIETDRTEITNCYFETPKEITTRNLQNSYIANNTFVGTWVISGNSGPAAIHDNYTENLDISNNRIYGKDEITDPNGYVVTGDQTFARTIVFQKSLGASINQYIMNNQISRVGELNYNSGEHILFEDEGVTYVGNVTLSNNNKTLFLKDMPTDKWTAANKFKGYITGNNGEIKPGYERSVNGQVVIISKGRGKGQWRTITKASANRTVTVDRDWDVQPDANSTFVVVPAFITPVVYNNTIEGPKMYYKNYNSTNGVNAYGSMVGTVIDRNHFSQMQAGIAINPHYNMKSYTYNGKSVQVDFNFAMFADLLVMNNTIKDTRYGIWNFPSITMSSMDTSSAEADVDLQLCSIIRGNDISGQRRLLIGAADTNAAVDNNVMKRGGVAIVIGRDYWGSDQMLSTRYWMNDIVVENNILGNVANNNGNGFIDVSFSQNNTIIRNNTYNGHKKATYAEIEVERNTRTHNSNKKPQPPIYYMN